jgi:creatinine amidohydrolase
MKSTYLKNYNKLLSKKTAYIPLGTMEWHGFHLPLETDTMIASKICNVLAKKIPGYIVPPLYLGTDKKIVIDEKVYTGKDADFKKTLPGSYYFVKEVIFYDIICGLIENLKKQGFNRLIIITGHGSRAQIEVLKKIEKTIKGIIFINPFCDEVLNNKICHADEYETSLLWACYPKEKKRSLKAAMDNSEGVIKLYGYDPRQKASSEIGLELLNQIIQEAVTKINRYKLEQ